MSGVSSPRWTHVALPVGDLDATVAWYERFTPLRILERRAVPISETAWLTHPGQTENPFVWEPQDMRPPVGYICALNDPDGNVIEISHDQGLYESVQRLWGTSVPS